MRKMIFYLLGAAVMFSLILLSGATAAANPTETVFIYEKTTYSGTYYYGSNAVTFIDGVVRGDSIVEGIYKYETSDIYLKYPTAGVTMSMSATPSASILGGVVPKKKTVDINISSINSIPQSEIGLIFTSPAGVQTTSFGTSNGTALDWIYGGNAWMNNKNVQLENVMAGMWKVQAYFNTSETNEMHRLVASTPLKYRIGKDAYTFTVADISQSIEINADSIVKGNTFFLTIHGIPGDIVDVELPDGFSFVPGQINCNGVTNQITISGEGKTAVGITAKKSGYFKISATFSDGMTKTASITVVSGTVTVIIGAESYFIGEDVTISGTNTESATTYFYIKRNYMPFQRLESISADVKADKTWRKKISSEYFSYFGSGTYTLFAVAENISSEANLSEATYASATLILKQPHISALKPSETVTMGEKYTVSGVAKTADVVMYYLFGNDMFMTSTTFVRENGDYSFELNTANLTEGQYFVVVQHPMYDRLFNIGPVADGDGSYNIVMNTSGSYNGVSDYWTGVLFNTKNRQSANAAEALCQALDTQNIDDIYAKFAFTITKPGAAYLTTFTGDTKFTPGQLVKIFGEAAQATTLQYYLFGESSCTMGSISVDENKMFNLTIDTTGFTDYHYYLGIQHPMENGRFDIWAEETASGYNIIRNPSGKGNNPSANVILYNTNTCRGNEAAQAFLRALDATDIDDIGLIIKLDSENSEIKLADGIYLNDITVVPQPPYDITTETPVVMTAYLTIRKDTLSSADSLLFTTELVSDTAWQFDILKGEYGASNIDLLPINTLNGNLASYNIPGFDIDYPHDVTVKVTLSGKFTSIDENLILFTIAGKDFSYSHPYPISGIITPPQNTTNDTITMFHGWNFISVPKTLNSSENTAGHIFKNINTENHALLGYDTAEGKWVQLQTTDTVEPLTGYWIYTEEQATINLTYPFYPASPSTKTLYKGWNAIGLSADGATTAKTVLAGVNWRTLLPWNLAKSGYDAPIVNGGSEANSPDRLLTLGNGCWLYVESEGMLIGLTA